MINPECSFLTMEQFHNKRGIGSTRLRVHQLIKYWPGAEVYKYGSAPEALVFQKVYCGTDYKFPAHYKGVTILDICDPDWTEGLLVAETARVVDGVTCPSEPLAEFMRQLTDKPVKVIPDRHDLTLFPYPKLHKGPLQTAVWFGYRQNAELLQFVIPTLERLGIGLTIISNDDPFVQRWATKPNEFKYTFVKFNEDTLNEEMQKSDVCILPVGNRPKDRFKSNNKTIIAQLCGLPVVSDIETLEAMQTSEARNIEAKACYAKARELYDVKLSVQEMKDFIRELQDGRR